MHVKQLQQLRCFPPQRYDGIKKKKRQFLFRSNMVRKLKFNTTKINLEILQMNTNRLTEITNSLYISLTNS